MDVVRDGPDLASELICILGRELKAAKNESVAELEVTPRVSHLLYHTSLICFLIYLKGDLRKVEELEQQWSNR